MADLITAFELLERYQGGITGGLSAYIAGPDVDGAYSRLVQNSGRRSCRAYGRAPAWLRALPLSSTAQIKAICDPYLAQNGWDIPTPVQTSTGGQCEGVEYVATYETRQRTSTPFACTEFSAWSTSNTVLGGDGRIFGPVSNVETRITDIDPAANFGEDRRIQFIFQTANGARFLNLGGVAGRTYFSGCGPSREYRNLSFTRADGLPDECGDVPPELAPGINRPPPGDVPPEFNPRPDPRNPDFPFIPLLPDTDPELGPIDFSPEIPVTIGGGSPGPLTNPGSPTAVGAEAGSGGGVGQPGAADDVPFSDAPDGEVWVGCLVEVDAPSSYGNIADTGPANTVFPRVIGNVSLTYEGGRGTAVPVRSQWTEVGRSVEGLQVIGCRVNLLPGVAYRVLPVSSPLCPNGECS